MAKFSSLLFFMGVFLVGRAQQPEREHRILKSQFPAELYHSFEQGISEAKKVRCYKEIDSVGTAYSIRFKRGRLQYRMHWDAQNKPARLGFQISEIDFPSEVFAKVTDEISKLEKAKIKRMFQNYPLRASSVSQDLRTALQNSFVDYLQYELWVRAKQNGVKKEFVYIFNAQGELWSKREALPANYDHVLY
jgi:hypothetical protein